jgi:hypothetical protein
MMKETLDRGSFPPALDKACVDELIEKCCRPESIGQVYHFLLQAFDNDASLARAEFDAFMRGTLSEQARAAAERSTEADRYEEPGAITDRLVSPRGKVDRRSRRAFPL